MKKNKRSKRRRTVSKISEMLTQYAGDYIDLGQNLDDEQRLLDLACVAWNLAVLPEERRAEALNKFVRDYKLANPDLDDADDMQHDLEMLIQQKLVMFPEVMRVVVAAKLHEVDGNRSIIAVSANPGILQK